MYGKAVTAYRPKPTHKTHVDIGRGILIPVKEVNNLRRYFMEFDIDGDGTSTFPTLRERTFSPNK